ncbi:unnamed protein product [Boreogadus saida]
MSRKKLAWANKELETFVCILGEEEVVYDVYVAAAAIDIRPTTRRHLLHQFRVQERKADYYYYCCSAGQVHLSSPNPPDGFGFAMKVTVTFGDTAVVVPCKDGWTVRDVTDQATRRYRKILEKAQHLEYVVRIHHVEYDEGGILDMDDPITDLLEDKDRVRDFLIGRAITT